MTERAKRYQQPPGWHMKRPEQIRRAWNHLQRELKRDPSIAHLSKHTGISRPACGRWVRDLLRYKMISRMDVSDVRMVCPGCDEPTVHVRRDGVYRCSECQEGTE